MSLQTFNLALSAAFALSRTNSGFNTTKASNSVNYNLNGLNVATFNQCVGTQYSIAASGSQVVDLTNLTNLVYESVNLAHALTLIVIPTGAGVIISPGASNALTWFFGGTSPTVTVNDGGCFMFSEPAAGPGQVVDSMHKNLLFTNASGTNTLTLTIMILGSTT